MISNNIEFVYFQRLITKRNDEYYDIDNCLPFADMNMSDEYYVTVQYFLQ